MSACSHCLHTAWAVGAPSYLADQAPQAGGSTLSRSKYHWKFRLHRNAQGGSLSPKGLYFYNIRKKLAVWTPPGAKKGQKEAKNSILPHKSAHRAYFGWKGWNKVGTPMETSRPTSLGDLPDPDCPKYGPTGAKKGQQLAENSILATQISS